MTCRWLIVGLLMVIGAQGAWGADNKAPEGFKALFNGTDLKGWKATGDKNVWGAKDGVIFVEKGGGGWLLSEEEYGDFELRLEYKLSGKANSGVALRTPDKGDPAYVGMEIQLIDDEGWPGKLADYQHTGSIYDVSPAKKQANKKIGEWNTMVITCKGSKVKIVLNGEVLNDADLSDFKEAKGKKHPGILREKGHVGVQSYNVRVEFKNIYLKPL